MHTPQSALYIGLMSGTSLDGVDGVLASFADGRNPACHVLAHAATAFAAPLRAELLALNHKGGADELHRAALAANALARCYAHVVQALLCQSNRQPAQIAAIGCHGQTLRHCPQAFDGTGYTVQLNNPALLAELCAIPVVADLRTRDIAAGGQGAPLACALHQYLFATPGRTTLVLNIGGIANLTVLAADGGVLGFDCGPGNVLMDLWCQQHTGQPYDADGRWAASGQVLPALLRSMEDEPFLHAAPPKSTGRDLFHARWLAAHLQAPARCGAHAQAAADVQATLLEYTARCAARAAQHFGSGASRLLVCGGGAYNRHLMQRLRALLAPLPLASSAAAGLPPQQVEAAAFAWLARQRLLDRPGNLPPVTGARGPRVLGAVYAG